MNTKSICWLFLLVIALSYSGKTLANISMSHVWQSTTEQSDGLFAVTWLLIITNQGDNGLSQLAINALYLQVTLDIFSFGELAQ